MFVSYCAFPFFAALLTVGSAQGLPGGPTDINANDPEVQAALKFAMKEYNKGSSDQYLYVVVDVIRVQGQVVAGFRYFLTVKIAKTLCRKNSNPGGPHGCRLVWLSALALWPGGPEAGFAHASGHRGAL
uniref:Cystatin domain-containing protein n=1 Tax=Oryzias latipes TaxID=8090 RepID=A0A3B3I024_ORYLA